MLRKFYDKEGVLRNEDELYLFKDDIDFHKSILDQWDRCLVLDEFVERKWRNKELLDTDWMLTSDATYAGLKLEGSAYLEDIKNYREALREYDLTYANRPARPPWFT